MLRAPPEIRIPILRVSARGGPDAYRLPGGTGRTPAQEGSSLPAGNHQPPGRCFPQVPRYRESSGETGKKGLDHASQDQAPQRHRAPGAVGRGAGPALWSPANPDDDRHYLWPGRGAGLFLIDGGGIVPVTDPAASGRYGGLKQARGALARLLAVRPGPAALAWPVAGISRAAAAPCAAR